MSRQERNLPQNHLESKLGFKPDSFDAALLANRQRLVLEMYLHGQISEDDVMHMYNQTSSPEAVKRESGKIRGIRYPFRTFGNIIL